MTILSKKNIWIFKNQPAIKLMPCSSAWICVGVSGNEIIAHQLTHWPYAQLDVHVCPFFWHHIHDLSLPLFPLKHTQSYTELHRCTLRLSFSNLLSVISTVGIWCRTTALIEPHLSPFPKHTPTPSFHSFTHAALCPKTSKLTKQSTVASAQVCTCWCGCLLCVCAQCMCVFLMFGARQHAHFLLSLFWVCVCIYLWCGQCQLA